MGTLATIFRKTDYLPAAGSSAVREKPRQMVRHLAAVQVKERDALDQYKLRALPNDDVYFYCKHIDNSRLVRQADPQTKGQCWSAIGAACVLAVVSGLVMTPKLGSILTGYKLQQLKHEQAVLLEERRNMDVEEASLLSPVHLDQLAQKQKLDRPQAGQTIRLQPRGNGAFASVVLHTGLKSR